MYLFPNILLNRSAHCVNSLCINLRLSFFLYFGYHYCKIFPYFDVNVLHKLNET